MATNNTDFISAIYQIAEERGLDQEQVLDQVKKAYLTAYRKMTKEAASDEEMAHFDVDIDLQTGDISVIANKKVVSVITDPLTQILESQAKLIDSRLRAGDHIEIDVTPEDFGRIAAQAALQRLMQGLRDAELETMMENYKDKVGKIISGIIQRKDPQYVRVEVDRAEAIMPTPEQIPGEFYRSAERKRFLLLRLANSATDKRMVLSRASNDFLKALFDVEVPEVATGSVEIMNIAREAGSRSKVAVHSLHEKVDAIGSCVGPRGTRIDSIMNEISPEKVDIILWDKDIKTFIINSLSPAKVVDIKVDKKEAYAKVLVAEDMLSLAIGKDGQNVRLAAKLTGYKIDITSDRELFENEETLTESREKSLEASAEPEEKEAKKKTRKSKVSTEETEVTIENSIDAPVDELDVNEGSSPITMDDEEVDELIERMDLTDRQKNLLRDNNAMTLDQIKQVIEGEKEIPGFTKRDVEKLRKVNGLNG